MIERFNELVANSSVLSAYIDKVREVNPPPGFQSALGYEFDATLDCAVVFDGQRYYDVQDINLAEDWWPHPILLAQDFDSLENLMLDVELVLTLGRRP